MPITRSSALKLLLHIASFKGICNMKEDALDTDNDDLLRFQQAKMRTHCFGWLTISALSSLKRSPKVRGRPIRLSKFSRRPSDLDRPSASEPRPEDWHLSHSNWPPISPEQEE
jgi:hypothetical protein